MQKLSVELSKEGHETTRKQKLMENLPVVTNACF